MPKKIIVKYIKKLTFNILMSEHITCCFAKD